jgi:type I site-specific restriction endonuclease
MSGGHFDYKQYTIQYIADEVEQLILKNDSQELNEWGEREGYHFTEETIEEFKKGLYYLNMAQIYAQRIDWLVSDDDDEESFHNRLYNDLQNMYTDPAIEALKRKQNKSYTDIISDGELDPRA